MNTKREEKLLDKMPNQNLERRIREILKSLQGESDEMTLQSDNEKLNQALSSILQAFREIVPEERTIPSKELAEAIQQGSDKYIAGFNSAIQQIEERVGR